MNIRLKITSWFESLFTEAQPLSRRIFIIALYAWFLVQWLILFPLKNVLWGTTNAFYRHGFDDGILENIIYRLIYDPEIFPWIWWTHVVACVLAVLPSLWSAIPRCMVWITGLMLYYSAYRVFNSGMLLMLLLSCYSIFIHGRTRRWPLILLSNVFVGLCYFQITWVYFSSAVFKWMGTQWVEGTAVYYALNIERFGGHSIDWSQGWICMLSMMITWMVLLFQTLFPALIWLRKWRMQMILIGLFLHIGVGVLLHLWDFALAMLVAYTLFVRDEDWKRLAKLVFRRTLTSTPE
ncbi:MAG: hypothetical protein ACKOZY_10860 [Flavobacteriales bacterium]